MVVLVQGDAEFCGSGEDDMQVFLAVRQKREADGGGELRVEVLVWIGRVQGHVAVAIFNGKLFSRPMPVAKVVVNAVAEGVDDEGGVGLG